MSSPVTQQQIAENVRVALARRKVSQVALAQAIGLHNLAMWRRVRGVTPFKAEELAAVAEYLDIPLTDLLAAA